MNFLKHNLTLENVFTVLDFARQGHQLYHLVHWCLKFLENNINICNVANLIQYLDKKPDPEFETEHSSLKKFAFEIVRNNLIDASQKQKENLQFYEDFLIRNVEMDTFKTLANFICGETYEQLKLRNLQKHVFDFAHQNFETLQERNILKNIEKNFFINLVSYEIQKQKIFKPIQDIPDDDKMTIENGKGSDAQPKKGLKRSEPSHNDRISEENPALKQIKKGFVEKK